MDIYQDFSLAHRPIEWTNGTGALLIVCAEKTVRICIVHWPQTRANGEGVLCAQHKLLHTVSDAHTHDVRLHANDRGRNSSPFLCCLIL